MHDSRWHYFVDTAELQRAAVSHIAACATAAIAKRGEFHCVLAGGRTPQAIYARLATLETNWNAWILYFGDERCLPPGDAQRNDTMARAVWLDRVAIPAAQVYPIPAELGPMAGAARYDELLANAPEFDLVLLGIGEDGHTASLFPGDDAALRSQAAAVAVTAAPKPPPQRVSVTAARLGRSRSVLFLGTGVDKRDALQRWHRGERIPAALVDPPGGVDIYTDQLLT
jgi:6-phosphogluconolactonase